jgi:hypothetical protein
VRPTELVAVDLDGSNERVLTPLPGVATWSIRAVRPDRIVVFGDNPTSGPDEVFFVDPTSGAVDELEFPRTGWSPWIDPDSPTVLVQSDEGVSRLEVGADPVEFSTLGSVFRASRSGRFVGTRTPHVGTLLDLEGEYAEIELQFAFDTSRDPGEGCSDWQPPRFWVDESREVAFAYPTDEFDVAVYDLADSTIPRTIVDVPDTFRPWWFDACAGRLLGATDDGTLMAVAWEGDELVVSPLSGPGVATPWVIFAVSPTGQTIGTVHAVQEQREYVILDVDTGTEQSFDFGHGIFELAPSFDDDVLVLVWIESGSVGTAQRIDLATGQIHSAPHSCEVEPRSTADGSLIVCNVNETANGSTLERYTPAGEVVQLGQDPLDIAIVGATAPALSCIEPPLGDVRPYTVCE